MRSDLPPAPIAFAGQSITSKLTPKAKHMATQNGLSAPTPPRLQRELKTIRAMVEIYCRDRHQPATEQPCAQCRELLAYAGKRLALCPYQHRKPTCGKCPIHCYKRDMRTRVREVMRHSGPKMIRHHPLLALRHLLDGLRRTPPSPFSSRLLGRDATD